MLTLYRYLTGNYHFFDFQAEWYGNQKSGMVIYFFDSPAACHLDSLWLALGVAESATPKIMFRPPKRQKILKKRPILFSARCALTRSLLRESCISSRPQAGQEKNFPTPLNFGISGAASKVVFLPLISGNSHFLIPQPPPPLIPRDMQTGKV